MKTIRVSGLVELDNVLSTLAPLDDIWHHIAKNSGSVEIASGFIESITETFLLFARTPEAGTRRDEIERDLRGFPVGKYIIYYRQSANDVEISRVIHGMRDQRSAFLNEN